MQKKKLSEADKKHFESEIKEWEVRVLEKKHEIAKIESQLLSIQATLDSAIETEQNKIRAAKAMIADYKFDFDNQVTYQGLENQADKAKKEIERIEKNILVRKKAIKEGLTKESRDETARREASLRHSESLPDERSLQ